MIRLALVSSLLFGLFVLPRQAPLSPPLQALVNTERDFAKTAVSKGLRDSFLDFFADNSIALVPAAESAKARLRSQPAQPFSELEITWEPRLGDVAAANDIGWLTGPSTIVHHTGPSSAPRFGNYLSVWKRQPDGQWRVYIDVGVNMPALPAFDPGFTRFPVASRYAGSESQHAATLSLSAADRDLNTHIAAGPAAAYAQSTTTASRLHRLGSLPLVGADAIGTWLAAHAGSMSAETTSAEAARSADLGYSYGTYNIPGTAPESGAYVRVWTRDARGRWLVVADVTQPTSR